MRLKIRKIGNSFGVLIPIIMIKAYAKDGFIELIINKKAYEVSNMPKRVRVEKKNG